MKRSDFYLVVSLLSCILQSLADNTFFIITWGVIGTLYVVLFIRKNIQEERQERMEKPINVNVAVEGDPKTGYDVYLLGDNPFTFAPIGVGETTGEAKADFFNSWYEMEALYNKQGRDFPGSVSFNFVEI